MDSSCSRLAHFAIGGRYFYLRGRLGLAMGQLSLLEIEYSSELYRINKYTSST
jgi:hypothetical protein